MRPMISAICLTLLGCRSGGSAPTAVAPTAAVSKCPQVADKFLDYYPSGEAPPPELATLFREIVVERCTQDGWSMQVQDCYLAVHANVDACAQGMTEPQRTTFQQEAETKLVAAAKQLGAQRGAPTEREDAGRNPVKSSDAPDVDAPKPKRPMKRAPRPSKASPRTADPCEGGE